MRRVGAGTSLALLAVLLTACGRHRPTIDVQAARAPGYSAGAPTTPAPATSASVTSTSTSPGSTGTSSTPPPPPPPPPVSSSALVLEVTGPGPARPATHAPDVVALTLRVANPSAEDLELRTLSVRASGTLDDAQGISTMRLVLDRDGDRAFDRAVDSVLASDGFTQDDGAVAFRTPGLLVRAGSHLDALVLADLSGRGQNHDDLRLRPDAAASEVLTATGANAGLSGGANAGLSCGPALRLGPWVEPHEELAVAGEGLRPRVARDAAGRTHVALFQNLNGQSNVYYSLFDGRTHSTPFDVSRAARTAWNQDLALDAQGVPALVWEEWDGPAADFGIRFSRFDPAAFAWTPSVAVSASLDMSVNPRCAFAPDGLHVVWEDWGALGTTPRVLHRALTAAGWTGIAEVTSASAQAVARDPALCVLATGEVLVAWAESEGSRSEVRARRRAMGGAWAAPEVAVAGARFAARPELLGQGAVTHLALEDAGEVLCARRDALGWSAPVDVSRSPAASSIQPGLALRRGALHVVWIEDRNGPHVAHAEAAGGGFGAPELLTRTPAQARQRPVAVDEGDRLRVLWQDRSLGRQRLFATWCDDAPLEAPALVAEPGASPARPDLALEPSGALHLVYALDAGGNHEVFHVAEDAAGNFSAPEDVSRSATPSYQPTVAALGSGVLAAWEEDGPGGFAILAAARDAAGWSAPAAVSSASPAYAPRLSSAAGRAALAWTEAVAPGDFDVFLRWHDGAAFGPALAVAPAAGASSWKPDLVLAPDGSWAAVAWEEEAGARREVLVAVVDATGAASVAAVASSLAGQYAPRVAWRGGHLLVAWVEDGRVRAAQRRAGQATFDAPEDLSTGSSWNPALVVAGDVVALAFERWQGSDARALLSVLGPQGWSAAAAIDLPRAGPSQGVVAEGSPTAGVRVVWVEPGRIVTRARRER